MPIIDLSRIHQDADAILEQLQTQAEASGTFKDFFTGSTGFTLLQTQAAVGALNNYASESALQEAMLQSAKNDSSVYMYTAGQGVRVGRRVPATCVVSLTRPTTTGSQSIAEFSQFNVGGVFMFNRDTILFPIGVATVEVPLYQGKVVTRTVFGIGEDFQVWVSSEKDFEVSDVDVRLRVNNVPVPVVTNGLWNYKDGAKSAAQDWTSSKGHLMLKFGNDLFGLKPQINDQLDIIYAVTEGEDADRADFAGTTFKFATVDGVVTTGLTGGEAQKPASLYKSTTPNLWGAHDAAVTKNQYHAIAMQYPGVKDVRFYAQRELNPSDVRFMNLIKIVVLTTTPWNPTQQADFIKYMQDHSMYSGRFFFEEAREQTNPVLVDVFVRNTVNAATAKAQCEAAIAALFEKRFGFLGTHITRSDIELACFNAEEGVKFVRVQSPTTDIFVGVTPPEVVSLTPQPGLGTLPAGTYNYGVTAYNAVGETQITLYPSVILSSTGAVLIDWADVPNALGYQVYRRAGSDMNLLATVVGTSSFQDTGVLPLLGAHSGLDTSGVWYASAPSITVNINFSERVPFNNR